MKQLIYIDSVRRGRIVPPSLQVAITDYCFNQCIMCGHWKRENRAHMQISKWMVVLKTLVEQGLETVCYSGGDPFMHPGLNQVMEYHVNSKVPFVFITAGFFPSTIDLSLVAKAKWVRVSLDAIDPTVYSGCRGGVLSPDKIIPCIIEMQKHGTHVHFNMTAHRYNLHDIENVFRLALNLHVDKVLIKPVIHEPELALSSQQQIIYHGMVDRWKYKFHRSGIEHLMETDYLPEHDPKRCYACLYQLFINPDGEVYPCCIMAGDTEDKGHCLPLGNIFEWHHAAGALDTWMRIRANIQRFSEAVPPAYCKHGCLSRHRKINELCEQHWNMKSFF